MPHRLWGSNRCSVSLFTFLRKFIWEIWAITAISMSNCQLEMVIYPYFFLGFVAADYRRLPLFVELVFWEKYWFPWVQSYRVSTRRRLWGLLFSFPGWVSPLFSFWCLPNFRISGMWHRDRAGSSGAFSTEFSGSWQFRSTRSCTIGFELSFACAERPGTGPKDIIFCLRRKDRPSARRLALACEVILRWDASCLYYIYCGPWLNEKVK